MLSPLAQLISSSCLNLLTTPNTLQLKWQIPSLRYHNTSVQISSYAPSSQHQTTKSQRLYTPDLSAKLENTDVCTVHAAHVMKYIYPDHDRLSYDDIIRTCLYDDIHWKSAVASTVITDDLTQLYIRCQIRPSRHSVYRHAVQKAIPGGCFKCASHDHRADLCPVQSLPCTRCKRNDHMHAACGYQWLPCRHCAQFGHNSSDSSACPLLLSKDVTIINMKKGATVAPRENEVRA